MNKNTTEKSQLSLMDVINNNFTDRFQIMTKNQHSIENLQQTIKTHNEHSKEQIDELNKKLEKHDADSRQPITGKQIGNLQTIIEEQTDKLNNYHSTITSLHTELAEIKTQLHISQTSQNYLSINLDKLMQHLGCKSQVSVNNTIHLNNIATNVQQTHVSVADHHLVDLDDLSNSFPNNELTHQDTTTLNELSNSQLFDDDFMSFDHLDNETDNINNITLFEPNPIANETQETINQIQTTKTRQKHQTLTSFPACTVCYKAKTKCSASANGYMNDCERCQRLGKKCVRRIRKKVGRPHKSVSGKKRKYNYTNSDVDHTRKKHKK